MGDGMTIGEITLTGPIDLDDDVILWPEPIRFVPIIERWPAESVLLGAWVTLYRADGDPEECAVIAELTLPDGSIGDRNEGIVLFEAAPHEPQRHFLGLESFAAVEGIGALEVTAHDASHRIPVAYRKAVAALDQ
jgi:hypothetical protein